jgi:hypothetical protein
MMMSSVRAGGIRYILKRQAYGKRLLHHEKVGRPNTSNPITRGVGGGYIIGGVNSCSR